MFLKNESEMFLTFGLNEGYLFTPSSLSEGNLSIPPKVIFLSIYEIYPADLNLKVMLMMVLYEDFFGIKI